MCNVQRVKQAKSKSGVVKHESRVTSFLNLSRKRHSGFFCQYLTLFYMEQKQNNYNARKKFIQKTILSILKNNCKVCTMKFLLKIQNTNCGTWLVDGVQATPFTPPPLYLIVHTQKTRSIASKVHSLKRSG